MKKKNCCPCAVLKGRVYFDLNNNNQFNPGEEGVFTLVLTYPDNSVLQFNTESDGHIEEPVAVENIFLQMDGAIYMKYTIFARRDKLERFAKNGFINFLIYSQN